MGMIERKKRIMMMANDLPGAYKRIEYIEGTGTQYINTQAPMRVVSSFNTNWAMKFEITSSGTKIIAGQNDNYKQIPILNGKIRLDWALGNTNKYFSQSVELNTVYELRQNENTFIFEGESFLISSESNRDSKFALFGKIYPDETAEVSTLSNMKLYSFVAKNNGMFVLNLIPCIRKSDGKPGMYDTATKTFFTNAGTGEFIIPQ